MRTSLFAAVLVASAAAAASAQAAGTPEAVASGFYAIVTTWREGGIPDDTNLQKLRPFLSTGLASQLAAADRAELAYADKNKHAVPPLLEGDIFVSLFEGATGYHVGPCKIDGPEADCAAALSNSKGAGKPVEWTDHVLLRQGITGWQVDNVIYGGKWDFANKGSLRDSLAFAIANANGG